MLSGFDSPWSHFIKNIYKTKNVLLLIKKMAEKIDLGSVAYVMGILSIVLAFFIPLGSLVLGIIGVVQSNRAKSRRAKRLNIIGIVLSVLFLVLSIVALASSGATGVFPGV